MALFMNRWDVEEAKNRFRRDPVLAPATKFLYDYMELINDVSDGWANWSAGRKCADTLVDMVNAAIEHGYKSYDPDYVKPTAADVKKAADKILRFIKSRPDTFGTRTITLMTAIQLNLL